MGISDMNQQNLQGDVSLSISGPFDKGYKATMQTQAEEQMGLGKEQDNI